MKHESGLWLLIKVFRSFLAKRPTIWFKKDIWFLAWSLVDRWWGIRFNPSSSSTRIRNWIKLRYCGLFGTCHCWSGSWHWNFGLFWRRLRVWSITGTRSITLYSLWGRKWISSAFDPIWTILLFSRIQPTRIYQYRSDHLHHRQHFCIGPCSSLHFHVGTYPCSISLNLFQLLDLCMSLHLPFPKKQMYCKLKREKPFDFGTPLAHLVNPHSPW